MQQAAFKVCRVACREVCPPGEIGVYARTVSTPPPTVISRPTGERNGSTGGGYTRY